MILLYSFKNLPFLKILEDFGFEVFVFGKLKDDLEKFKLKVLEGKPDYIIGIAKSQLKFSTIEAFTVNTFNKGKVSPESLVKEYKLFLPQNLPKFLKVRKTPTITFCNWTMFKLAEFLTQEKLDKKITFIYIKPKDLNLLLDFICNEMNLKQKV